MNLVGLRLIKVEEDTLFKPFDCGDDDLNDFLLNKSKYYNSELLAATFVIEDDERSVAYFSIFNDSLRVEEIEFASKSAFKRFLKGIISHPKRHLKYFPAIKIGRLAVSDATQKSGIGTTIINYIITFAIEQNEKCACKFITVDAYAQSLNFYEKKGFEYFPVEDNDTEIRQMYLDLTPYINTEHDTAQ